MEKRRADLTAMARSGAAVVAIAIVGAACSPVPVGRSDPSTSAVEPSATARSEHSGATSAPSVVRTDPAGANASTPAIAARTTSRSTTSSSSSSSSTSAQRRSTSAERTFTVTVTVDGHPRSAIVHEPASSVGTAMPLLVALHGSSSDGQALEARTGFDRLADRFGFVVVYPNGVGDGTNAASGSWNAGQCCPPASSAGIDDVGFIVELLDQLERSLPIDHRRIYLTGHSNGAMMVQRLACEHAARFAAIASVAGTLGIGRCAPARAVSILEIHGTGDTNVSFSSAMDSLADWRSSDGCGANAHMAIEGSVTTRTWQCQHGADVESVEIAGAEHPWPGSRVAAPTGQVTSTAIDASSVVWSFLSRHVDTG